MAIRLYHKNRPIYEHSAAEPPDVPYTSGWLYKWGQDLGTYDHGLPPKVLMTPGGYYYDSTYPEFSRTIRVGHEVPSGTAYPWTYPSNWMSHQMISVPLVGDQTISGSFRNLLRGVQYNAAADTQPQIMAHVVSNDGQTVRGVLYAGSTNSTLQNEFTTRSDVGPVTTWFPSHLTDSTWQAVSTVNALDGDRIVIEVGLRQFGFVSYTDYANITVNCDMWNNYDAEAAGLAQWNTTPPDPKGAQYQRNTWTEFSASLLFEGMISGDVIIDMGGWAGLTENPPIGGTAALAGQTDLVIDQAGYLIELRAIAGALDVDVQDEGYLVKALIGSVDLDVDLLSDVRQIQPAPVTYATLPMQWLDPVEVVRETRVLFDPLQVTEYFHLSTRVTAPIVIPDPRPTQPGEIPEEPGNFGSPVVGGIDIRALFGVTVTMPVPELGDGKPVGDSADQTMDDPVPPDYGGGGGGGGGMPG